MAAITKAPASTKNAESVRRRRFELFVRSPHMKQLRRVVRIMRRLEGELEELSDLDAGGIMGLWHRAGVPLDDDDPDDSSERLLEAVEFVENDTAGFLWSLRLIADLLESRVEGGRRSR